MFRGNHPARVDEKGRLKLPAEFKRLVDEKYGTLFYITSRDGVAAEIYPMPEWQRIEERLAAIPSFNAAKRKYLERVNYYGQTAEMDAQGRVLIPQILRETAGVTGDVLVFGYQTYLQVSNREDFTKHMDSNPMTEEDFKDLASMGF